MDITITGGEVPANSDSQPTADPSAISPKSDRRHTTRTAKVTPEMAINILEDAVIACQKAGISIGTQNWYKDGARYAVIVIDDCIIDDAKHLQLVSATSGKGAE